MTFAGKVPHVNIIPTGLKRVFKVRQRTPTGRQFIGEAMNSCLAFFSFSEEECTSRGWRQYHRKALQGIQAPNHLHGERHRQNQMLQASGFDQPEKGALLAGKADPKVAPNLPFLKQKAQKEFTQIN